MIIGVISDTHGSVPAAVFAAFEGVAAILHAGDVGDAGVAAELETIAPVFAVRGNTDRDLPIGAFPHYLCREFEGVEVLVVHRLQDAYAPDSSGSSLVTLHRPLMVVFGHTHEPSDDVRQGVRRINPGSASHPRGSHPPTVARIEIEDGLPRGVEFIPLR